MFWLSKQYDGSRHLHLAHCGKFLHRAHGTLCGDVTSQFRHVAEIQIYQLFVIVTIADCRQSMEDSSKYIRWNVLVATSMFAIGFVSDICCISRVTSCGNENDLS